MEDAALLEQFISQKSETAFQALVDRHSAMVYGVCARGLGAAAAEDAAQAVFIILARKAPQLRSVVSLGGWLYRTAQLTVAESRRLSRRRAEREQRAAQRVEAERNSAMANSDSNSEVIRARLDEAITSLRSKQQDAVVLHYLQGLTMKETAAALRCSEDAVKKRIEYGLEKLRNYFAQHGITLAGAALGSALQAEASRAVPVGLSKACATSALKGAAAATSASIASGALKAMFWTKLKFAALIPAILALLAVLAAARTPRPAGAEGKGTEPAASAPAAAAVADDDWNFFSGTKSISVVYGDKSCEIADAAAIQKLVGAIEVTRIENGGCKNYAQDRTLTFHRGAKGDFQFNMTEDGDGFWMRWNSTGCPTALITIQKKFFDTLNQQLKGQFDILQNAPDNPAQQFVPRKQLSEASLKAGFQSAWFQYKVGGLKRLLQIDAADDLQTLTRIFVAALSHATVAPGEKRRDELYPLEFYALTKDNAEFKATYMEDTNLNTALGYCAAPEELRRELNRLTSKYEKRTVDVLKDNAVAPEDSAKLDKIWKLFSNVESITLLKDARGAELSIVLDQTRTSDIAKAFEFAAILPQRIKAAPASAQIRIKPRDGEAVTVTFSDDENSNSVDGGVPVEVDGVGQVWLNQGVRSVLLMQDDDLFVARTMARAFEDFPRFLKNVKTVEISRRETIPNPFDGAAPTIGQSDSFVESSSDRQRLLSLLTIASMKLDPKIDCMEFRKLGNTTLYLNAVVGHDLKMFFTGPHTAAVEYWGTVEFKNDVVAEIMRIANALKAEREGTKPPSVGKDAEF